MSSHANPANTPRRDGARIESAPQVRADTHPEMAILKQLEDRIAALDAEFGRRRHPLVPHSATPRDNRRRIDVFKKLRLPNAIEARIAAKEAFARRDGSYACLLVCRTTAVIDAFLFEGVPGIRASLLDLAAFAVILAGCVDELAQPNSPSSPKSGARR